MEFRLLNTNFIDIDIIDSFDSMIWVERYFKYGDFEIYLPYNKTRFDLFKEDYYVYCRESDRLMIIEDRLIKTDEEKEKKYLTITGRSLESILERRIIWGQTILSGNFQDGIKKLIDESIIAPTIVERKIDNFVFEVSTDPTITELTIDAQFNGENLYPSIQGLCEEKGVGFKITLGDDNTFVFKLYSGVDRSYTQTANSYVVFSPNFDNLLSSSYIESKRLSKNVSLVAGEGEGSARKTVVVGEGSGLGRREIFTDATWLSSTIDGGTLTPEEYNKQLEQRGFETLAINSCISSFEGEADTSTMFKYGEDFFMGDIVQIANEDDLKSRSRVAELIRSKDLNGEGVFSTFIVA